MSKKAVEFFYDVISPYSWFAFEVMCRYQNRWNINLKLRPFFFHGVLNASGNQAPVTVPAKARYLHRDLDRQAKYFNVPLTFPAKPEELLFIKGSLTAQRFLTAVDMDQPQMLEKVSRELWLRAWSRDEDISEPESLAQAAKLAGLSDSDIAELLPKIKDEAVKERLKKTTQEALDMGAFGSPLIVTEVNGQKEWIFGSDRFPVLADWLGEKWEGPQPGVSSKL